MTLTDAADELYGADPATFVTRRAELVKQARSSGDKGLAAEIGALRRPTVAAWYLNLLARSGAQELDDLIALGVTMREAQVSLDMTKVTSLAPRRRELETAVVRRLDMLLAARGITASPAAWAEVGHTLTAVVADASAAAAVRSGCLTRSLVYAGFGEVDLSDAVGAELEAWADRRAADRAAGVEQLSAAAAGAVEPEPPVVRQEPEPDVEILEARARLAQAEDEHRDARRALEQLERAYEAAQERVRAAAAAVAGAQSAVAAAERAATHDG